MRIAVVADVHSNHIALEEVLKDINKKDIDKIFFWVIIFLVVMDQMKLLIY